MKKRKVSFMIDISGSMSHSDMEICKEALIIFNEALKDRLDIRVVAFASHVNPGVIVIKDFGKEMDERRFDLIGRHNKYGGTPTGIVAQYEYEQYKKQERELKRKIDDLGG